MRKREREGNKARAVVRQTDKWPVDTGNEFSEGRFAPFSLGRRRHCRSVEENDRLRGKNRLVCEK